MSFPGALLATLDISDARACQDYLAALPLTNTREAHRNLSDLLATMAHRPPPPAAYLGVLEAARLPLSFVQDQLAQRYADKPLPPTESEEQAFHLVLALWQMMARGYAHVAQLGGADVQVQQHLALICQRCVHYAGRVILEYFRARRETSPGVWIDLHGYYDTAEEWELATVAVPEPLSETAKSQSSSEAYAAILLVDLANPYSHGTHEFVWIARWAERFAPLTSLVRLTKETADATARAFGIDLMQDNGVRPLEMLTLRESVRHFDTSRLMPEMRRILTELKKYVAPTTLGLGEDCSTLAAGRLLMQLYRPWCLNAKPRRFQRRPTSGVAQVYVGFEAIHYCLSGEEFEQPEQLQPYTRSDMERISTLRPHHDSSSAKLHAAKISYPLENWEVADQSISGFRLQRGAAGGRIEHGQLFCLKPPDGEHFLLARVSWYLMLDATGWLLMGIHILPGVPLGVSVRLPGTAVSPTQHYARAFLLPALSALNEPDTLVLPPGWFQPARIIELYTDRLSRVRLTDLLSHGPDFERVSFQRL